MNVRTILLWGSIAVLLLIQACQNPTGPEQQVTSIPTLIRGTVLRNDNLTPVTNAIVYDIGGLARDTSKTDGTFRLVYQLLSQTKTRIIGSRSGFGNDTASVTLNPGVDTTIVLRLRADSTSPSGAVSTGKAANIVLVGSGADNISIRGTGSNETALLLFEVRDSLGSPIAGVNKLTVHFSILGGPGGGEYVFPVSGDTDPLTGRVTTRVSSGTKAGVLQIVASATVSGTPSLTIKSSPIRVTISGGLPVEERFSLSRTPINIAGGVYDNLRAQVMVIVGDKEGNPVQPGTAISFSTTGGIIQPNALTDKDGIATVDLISGNPRPANSVALVTARTIGDSGKVIQKQIAVLFSGGTRILTPSTAIVVPDSGSTTFEYRVQDPNGFPLVGGTNITLSVDGPGASELELSGDVTRSLEDSGDPTTTLFKATVRDKKLRGPAGAVTFKLTIVSQNGNVSSTFPGLVLIDTSTVIPASKSGQVSSLTFVGITNAQLSVSGTGANEVAKLTFVAKDSLGNPVELRKRAYITFSLSPTGGVGGGEFLFPVADSTDAVGQVTTTFNAGTRSGVLQVIARANAGGRSITSSPIKITISGGLPDSNSFTANLSRLNMPGLVKTGTLGAVSVQVGDKFGNAVQPGTALYFSTSGGLIQATATTSEAGQASVSIQGGNPAPNEPSLGGAGFGFITVQTVGEGGKAIRKKIPFLFSGAPLVHLPNNPNDTVVIPAGGFADVVYRIEDLNGNPISSGHRVETTVGGFGAPSVNADFTDLPSTTPDTRDKSGAQYKFRVSDKSPTGGAESYFYMTVSVTGESGTAFKKFYGHLLPAGPSAPRSGYASSLTVGSISSSQLSIRGTGAAEAAKITFVAMDSVGNALDPQRKALVNFSISPVGGLGGGEFVSPSSGYTDSLGQVSTTFNTGTKAGVVQIVATANVLGRTITSSPIRLTIFGGLPDSNKFTASLAQVNMPGLIKAGPIGTVNVQVGDKFGNPVQPNTALSFGTSGGLIQASAGTNETGQASATIYGGNPAPNEPSLGGLGHGYVTVQTVGENGVSILKRIPFLFSGVTRIVVPSTTVSIPDSGVTTFQYRIQDVNGNPLVAGTSVNLTVEGPGSANLQLSGDVAKTLLDLDDPATTLLTATVQDKVLKGANGAVTFKVTVASPNGNAVTTFPGVVLLDTTAVAPVVLGGSKPRSVASLTLLAGSLPPTLGPIAVKGTGSTEAVRITFVAKDSVGNAIDATKRAYVTFQIKPNGGTGGGEYLAPAADSTDAGGQVSTTLNAGLKPGVVQVLAQTISNGKTITSSPVTITISQGLADQAHFTMAIATAEGTGVQVMPQDTISLATWPQAGANVAVITVQVGDRYGNPVQPGTALYFGASAGLIYPRAVTNDNGSASVVWQGGNPAPVNDTASIWVQTVGDGGASVGQRNKVRLTQSLGSYRSGFASSLTLRSNVTNQLSVRGTGATEATTLTFVARDSSGNLLDPKRRILVNFSISPTNGLGGGEFLSPISAYTDANGEVITTFNSGVRSGVVQIVATAIVPGQTISVASGRIAISGGFPDPTKITAFLSRVNMPGLARTGPIGTLSLQVGDKFGNPVQTGTAVSFSSNGGLIQPFAQTDVNGLASVTLQGGKPFPNDPTAGGPGYGTITIQTVGEGGAAISVPTTFLFSGAPIVTLRNVPTDTIKIFDASSYDIDFTVADVNGNPVSAGHTVSVTYSGSGAAGIVLSGDVGVSTPDTQDKVNFTRYRFRATDNAINGGPSGELVFTITVSGESGTSVRKFYGTLYSPQVANTVPPSARQPSQIAFLGITATDIYVAGVGNTENSVITYEVRDSLGIPIDKSKRTYATFSSQFFPNSIVGGGSGPTLVPNADSTDDSGKLRASVVSGTQSGVIQIVAKIFLPGGSVVTSQPVKVSVHAGFPDPAHFSFRTSRYVFPGLDRLFIGPPTAPSFTVVVGDTFSNPVQENTAVYFHSQAGVIATGTQAVSGALSSYTDKRGIAASTLITGNPLPNAIPFYDPSAGSGRLGYHWVYAQTQGKAAKTVIDSILLVWAGAPIVITGVPVVPLAILAAGGSTVPISITVKDRNGNPLPDGTQITATVLVTDPPLGWNIRTSLSATIPNAAYARFPGANITDFTFSVTNSSGAGTVSAGMTYLVQITVASEIETTNRFFSIVLQ